MQGTATLPTLYSNFQKSFLPLGGDPHLLPHPFVFAWESHGDLVEGVRKNWKKGLEVFIVLNTGRYFSHP